jgi:hypothetical protein
MVRRDKGAENLCPASGLWSKSDEAEIHQVYLGRPVSFTEIPPAATPQAEGQIIRGLWW